MAFEYQRGNDHVYRLIAGEHLLVALRREVVSPLFALTDTGAALWTRLADWSTEEALVDELTQRFEVEPDVARVDVVQFLEQLRSVGALLTREAGE
jgi:hypothetical protein